MLLLSRTSDSRLIVGIANMPGPGDTLFGARLWEVSVGSICHMDCSEVG